MTHLLDVKGLACPLPILRAKKQLKSLSPGEELEVLATDPGSVEDFDAFCDVTGHALESHGETDRVFTFVIRKKR